MQDHIFAQYPVKKIEIDGLDCPAYDLSSLGMTGAFSVLSRQSESVMLSVSRSSVMEITKHCEIPAEVAKIFRVESGKFVLHLEMNGDCLDIILPAGLMCLMTQTGSQQIRDIVPSGYMSSITLH